LTELGIVLIFTAGETTMAGPTHMTMEHNGHKVQTVYPRVGFESIFRMASSAYKWESTNTKYGLGVVDQKILAREVDSAINNVENLDLA
jgi:hypothetical protein